MKKDKLFGIVRHDLFFSFSNILCHTFCMTMDFSSVVWLSVCPNSLPLPSKYCSNATSVKFICLSYYIDACTVIMIPNKSESPVVVPLRSRLIIINVDSNFIKIVWSFKNFIFQLLAKTDTSRFKIYVSR